MGPPGMGGCGVWPSWRSCFSNSQSGNTSRSVVQELNQSRSTKPNGSRKHGDRNHKSLSRKKWPLLNGTHTILMCQQFTLHPLEFNEGTGFF